MISGWHIVHLPVRLMGRSRPVTVVEQVIVSWPDLWVTGFLLASPPFRFRFLPARQDLRITVTGVEIPSLKVIERRSRRWVREQQKAQKWWQNWPVESGDGQMVGRVKDFFFDEKSLAITHVVISRGIVGDLLSGAWVLEREALQFTDEGIKLLGAGAP